MKANREKQGCFLVLVIYQSLEGTETLDPPKKLAFELTEQELGWLSSDQFDMKRNESYEVASGLHRDAPSDLGASF